MVRGIGQGANIRRQGAAPSEHPPTGPLGERRLPPRILVAPYSEGHASVDDGVRPLVDVLARVAEPEMRQLEEPQRVPAVADGIGPP